MKTIKIHCFQFIVPTVEISLNKLSYPHLIANIKNVVIDKSFTTKVLYRIKFTYYELCIKIIRSIFL